MKSVYTNSRVRTASLASPRSLSLQPRLWQREADACKTRQDVGQDRESTRSVQSRNSGLPTTMGTGSFPFSTVTRISRRPPPATPRARQAFPFSSVCALAGSQVQAKEASPPCARPAVQSYFKCSCLSAFHPTKAVKKYNRTILMVS
jgi:hypothetical protein